MILSKAQQAILDNLKKRPMGMSEILDSTGYSESGIRGRIAELRHKGYVIELKEPKNIPKMYHLEKVPDEKETKEQEILDDNAKKVVNILERFHYFGKVIHYENIAEKLGISAKETEEAVAHLFDKYNVIQFTANTVKILKKDD